MHDVVDRYAFGSFDHVTRHRVCDGVVKDSICKSQIFAGGIEKGSQLIIPEVGRGDDGAGIFQLFRCITAGLAGVLQRFTILDRRIQLKKNRAQIVQDDLHHVVLHNIDGGNGICRFLTQRFRGHLIHHVPRCRDRACRHHPNRNIISHGRNGRGAQRGYYSDPDKADQGTPGKHGMIKTNG